jgi:hypothetical protein
MHFSKSGTKFVDRNYFGKYCWKNFLDGFFKWRLFLFAPCDNLVGSKWSDSEGTKWSYLSKRLLIKSGPGQTVHQFTFFPMLLPFILNNFLFFLRNFDLNSSFSGFWVTYLFWSILSSLTHSIQKHVMDGVSHAYIILILKLM